MIIAGIVHRLVYQTSNLRRWVQFPLPAFFKKIEYNLGMTHNTGIEDFDTVGVKLYSV